LLSDTIQAQVQTASDENDLYKLQLLAGLQLVIDSTDGSDPAIRAVVEIALESAQDVLELGGLAAARAGVAIELYQSILE
jgi:hypothetical protein